MLFARTGCLKKHFDCRSRYLLRRLAWDCGGRIIGGETLFCFDPTVGSVP